MLDKYNRRLQRRHPFVRVRWSDYRKCYVLEERVYRTRPLNPDLYPASKRDEYIQARDGYTTIEYFRALPPVVRLSDALVAARIEAEMQRAGVRDAEEWADKLDAEDAARQEGEHERFRDFVGEAASDSYDRAQWRTGSRVGGYKGARA